MRAGDPAAFSALRQTVRTIISHKGYFVPTREREDLVQEVVLSVWREASRPGFRLRRSYGAFVRCIAHRRCVDWLRTQRSPPDRESVEQREPSRPDTELLEGEKRALAREILARLGAPCRELIQLHVGMRVSYRELSRRTGRSEMALRKQMSECIKRARRILDEIRGSLPEQE